MAEIGDPSPLTVRFSQATDVPVIGMLVDRTSFDETDNYGVQVDPSILAWKEGEDESYAVMKNGQVRRRLRWRPKTKKNKSRSSHNKMSSDASVGNHSVTSRVSKASVHSLTSTQTVKHANNSPKISVAPNNRPQPFQGVGAIANDSSLAPRFVKNPTPSLKDSASLGRKPSTKRFGLPPLFRRRSSPTQETDYSSSSDGANSPPQSFDDHVMPTLEEEHDDERRVDLRIPFSRVGSSPLRRVPSDSSQFHFREATSPKAAFRTESLEFIGQDRASPTTGEAIADDQELRFIMTHSATTRPRCEPVRKETGPVDIDDGSFLEAEKNLQAIHEMAAEHLKYREYREALEVFEEILRGQLARYGPKHYRVGTAHYNIAIVHLKRGDHQRAIQSCKDSIAVRKDALGDDHLEVADSLMHLGVCYLENRKYARAVEIFREALKIRRRKLGQRHPKVSKILNNIGCALYEMNELDVAKIAFDEALTVQRTQLQSAAEDPAAHVVTDQTLLSLACTLSNLGSIKLYRGQYDDALVDLEEALVIQESVLGEEHPLTRRTEESLLWVDRAREGKPMVDHRDDHTEYTSLGSLDGESGIIDAHNDLPPTFSLCAGREHAITTRAPRRSRLLQSIEQKIMALQAGLELTCGAMEDLSDNEDEGLVSI